MRTACITFFLTRYSDTQCEVGMSLQQAEREAREKGIPLPAVIYGEEHLRRIIASWEAENEKKKSRKPKKSESEDSE